MSLSPLVPPSLSGENAAAWVGGQSERFSLHMKQSKQLPLFAATPVPMPKRGKLEGTPPAPRGDRRWLTVFIDVPEDNRPAVGLVAARGLTVQRPLLRMCRGEAVCEDVGRLWASSGPEMG